MSFSLILKDELQKEDFVIDQGQQPEQVQWAQQQEEFFIDQGQQSEQGHSHFNYL